MPLRNPVTSLGGLPIQIDYTARDYEAIRAEMLKMAVQLLPEWTDKEPGDLGVTLIESMSYAYDILSYQLDRVQNESYLATAQTRESVINILRLIGYELAPATPATVGMVIRTDEDNVTLPSGFTVKTEATAQLDSLEFQLSEDVQLGVAGLYCVSYELAKVTRIFNESAATDDRLVFVAGKRIVEGVGISDGTADQVFLLPQSPVCLDLEGIQVTVNGDIYEARTSFIGTEPTDYVFVYRFLANQEVVIKFGDGVNGRIPPTNGSIVASYRINGGEETNRAGIGSIISFDSLQGVVEVYNVNQPTGGSDPESVLKAKKNGPKSLRALDRCVTLEDFETMAILTPGMGIRTARAVQGNSPIDVEVYVASEGDNPIPNGRWFSTIQSGWGTIGAVGRWLNEKKPVPTRLSILAPTAVNPYLEAAIYVYPNLLRQTIEFDVDLALQALFNEITSDFGEDVPLSAVIQAIENTRGVDYVNVTAFHRLPEMRYLYGNEDAFESATLSIDNMTNQMIREVYQIEWVNSVNFQLRLSSGELLKDNQSNILSFAKDISHIITFYNPNHLGNEPEQQVQFRINVTLGPVSPNQGDIWEFSVDNYIGNIETRAHEILVAPLQNDGRLNPSQFSLAYYGGI